MEFSELETQTQNTALMGWGNFAFQITKSQLFLSLDEAR